MKKDNNAIVMTSIISGVILVVALVALFSFGSSASGETVTVQGIAQIEAMPDLMVVYFSVEGKGETTEEARVQSVEIVDEMISNLEALGIERSEIVTENYNVYQNYDWTDDGREENGFIATHSIKIELSIDDTELLGKVVDAGVFAGALVNYINFELTQESQNLYKAEAMKAAAQDAKIKAESVAEGFDKKVGKLVSVQVNDFGYYPWRAYGATMEVSMDSATLKESVSNIQPGEEEISATVSATYKLR